MNSNSSRKSKSIKRPTKKNKLSRKVSVAPNLRTIYEVSNEKSSKSSKISKSPNSERIQIKKTTHSINIKPKTPSPKTPSSRKQSFSNNIFSSIFGKKTKKNRSRS